MLKEIYDSVKMVLGILKYIEYNWTEIGDFKTVDFRIRMQVTLNIFVIFAYGQTQCTSNNMHGTGEHSSRQGNIM